MSEQFPLSRPIRVEGEDVSELTLRDDTPLSAVGGIDLSRIGDPAMLSRIVAKVAGIPPSSAAQISIRDYAALTERMVDFFGISLPTGEI